MRKISVKKGDYIKIFGAIKPNKQGNYKWRYNFNKSIKDATKAMVNVHVIQKIENNPASVISCFMLEAIQAVAMVMGNGKPTASESMQRTTVVQMKSSTNKPIFRQQHLKRTICSEKE
jgi:hypothetical protein